MKFRNTLTRARTIRHVMALALAGAGSTAFGHSGDLDSRFATGGTVILPMSDDISSFQEPVDVDRTNRIVFGTGTLSGAFIGAMDSTGALDTSFGSSGYASLDEEPADLKVDSKNRIVVITPDFSGSYEAVNVTRFLSDGSRDSSFGTDGSAVLEYSGTDITPQAIALDDADNIFIAAQDPSDPVIGGSLIAVGKMTSDGVTDTTFGASGIAALSLMVPGTENSFAQAIAVAHDGAIAVTGYSTDPSGNLLSDVAKLQSNGAFDTSFAGVGFTQTDIIPSATSPHFSVSASVVFDRKNNIVVAGSVGDWATFSDVMVARFLSDGTYDPSFGTGSALLLSAGLCKAHQTASLMIDGRNNLLITGMAEKGDGTSAHMVAFRLEENGMTDTSFGDGAGSTLLPDFAWGGRGALMHDGDLMLFGHTDDMTSLIGYELVGYDQAPVHPPTHF